MWQAGFLIIVFATLGFRCLGINPKASFTPKKSNVARHFGRLDIGSGKTFLNKNEESNDPIPQAGLKQVEGYQSDQPASAAWHEFVESRLRQLNPTVNCGVDSMTLRVQGTNMPNFMVDGGDGPVSLTQIPGNCGFSMTQGPLYAAFTIHYQGCYVTQQGDEHVLPLHLWGIPIKMSCPLTINAPNVSCLSSGMVTKLGCSSADGLKLKVNGKWYPFIPASRTCGMTTESETDGVVLIAPYQSSCWQIEGDERFLSILHGNEKLKLSCPDSHDSYPYGHVEIISDQSLEPDVITSTDWPASDPEQPQTVTSSPTTTVDMVHQFPQMYYPFGSMPYHHKPKPYSYPWAFPPKAPTTTPQTIATTSSTVGRNPEQPQYHFPPMYYPYGPMPYHHKPRPYGYPWAFPPKAPTTTPQTIATSSTVGSNPEQLRYPLHPMYYPYSPMLYYHKLWPYGYPCAFPPKAPTSAPFSTVARNPKQPQNHFPQMYYPYGPMPYNQKPMPYRYPWPLPAKVPTAPTKITLTTIPTRSQTATKLDSVDTDPYQSRYAFHHMYSPFGPMHCQHGHSHHLGYPLAFPAKVFTASTTATTPTSMTTAPIIASNPQQPLYLFNQRYSPFGPMLKHPKPMPFDYPWAFPPKAQVTTQRIIAPTTKTSPTNCKGNQDNGQ